MNTTDLRLIAKLEDNGRASYIDLADSLGINPSTVAKRVQGLLNDGLISIKAIPNPYKMGFRANAIIAANISLSKIDDLANRLISNLNVYQLSTAFGRYNLIIGVHFPSWDDILNFVSSEVSEAADIYELQTFFVKEVKKRHYGLDENPSAGEQPVRLDETDMKLIHELAENGRYSGIYLADKLGISLSAASKRLATLLRDDIVKIRAVTNPNKMGFHSNAYLFIRTERNRAKDVCNRLQPYNEISTLVTLSNGYDIYASVVARTPQVLYQFIKSKVSPIKGITFMETLIRGEMIKRYYGSFHLDEENLSIISKFEPLP